MAFETNKKPAGKEKLRGGYYTPMQLASYLARWAIREGTQRILEPSAGDGNFVVACLDICQADESWSAERRLEIVAVEIEEEEVEKGKARTQSRLNNCCQVTWLRGDFFILYQSLKESGGFDVVLGNPPFIRFQYFQEESREIAFQHLRRAGYIPTRLANAWVAFVELSVELLRAGGRLAMVVPAELLQVKYAAELRTRLSKQFDKIVLVGFRRLVFPEIQQEILLLLAEGKRVSEGTPSNIYTIEYEDGDHLIREGNLANAIAHSHAKHSRNGMKWTALFLSDADFWALDEAEKSPGLIRLGEIAEVDIGIVTGRNSFFVLTDDMRRNLYAENYTIPIIGRTSALISVLFRPSDFEKYSGRYPSYLLSLSGFEEREFPNALKDYIRRAEQEKVHLGFKCRIRRRWFDVPSAYIPDGFIYRQIHRFPLLVVNEAKVTSTDTIHRVRFKAGVNPRLVAAAFLNSLTLAWAEVCGRSYGGGVLELEPAEAEELPLPYSEGLNLDIEKVDELLRRGALKEALDYVDRIVLHEHLGFDEAFIRSIRNAWRELRDRRIRRKTVKRV